MASFTSVGISDIITRRTGTDDVRFVAANWLNDERTEFSKAVLVATFGDC